MDFSTNELAVETIEQRYFTVDPTRTFELLEQLLEREQPRQTIVFCRTKRGTDKVFEKLARRRARRAGPSSWVWAATWEALNSRSCCLEDMDLVAAVAC